MLQALNISEEVAEAWGERVCGVFHKLGEDKKRYIILKVAKSEEDGAIKKTPEDYTRFLGTEACKDGFLMPDKFALEAWYRERQERAERHAESKKQEEERSDERRAIEKYRLDHEISIEELCHVVFSGRFGVGDIPCDRAAKHLLWLYPKEAESARFAYYSECAKRAWGRRGGKKNSMMPPLGPRGKEGGMVR